MRCKNTFMKPYTDLAPAYDSMLRHVDYEKWYQYLKSIMHNFILEPSLLLELGCGTGRFGAKFSRDDYNIYGMDRSIEMLRVARARAFKNFHIFCGDITQYSLKQKFDFIFSVHDTMNYLTSIDDIRKVLQHTREVMNRYSIFMFDMTSEYNILNNFDGKTTRYTSGGTRILWDNEYDEKNKLVYSYLTFKKPDGTSTMETHVQRIYEIDEIEPIIREEKLELIDVFSDYTFAPVYDKTVMSNFVLRKR